MSDQRAELAALVVSSEQLSWQERALCAQTDPEAFFPEKVAQPGRLSGFVFPVRYGLNVLSMP